MQEQIMKLLRAAKELINHPEADLEFPVAINDHTSILYCIFPRMRQQLTTVYIVANEIGVLIQHPKVHRKLEDIWVSRNPKEVIVYK
jgi:hypothetical protein